MYVAVATVADVALNNVRDKLRLILNAVNEWFYVVI